MEKQCKKCGKKLDNVFSDYCLNCLKSNYSTLVKEKQSQKGDSLLESCNSEETALIVLANIILIVGIIASITLMIIMIYMYKRYGDVRTDGMIIMIATLLSSIITWAILSCFAKISKNIREIRNKFLS